MPIEQKAAELERIVSLNEEIEWLGGGFGGFDERGKLRGVAEGPVWWKAGGWWKEGGFLLFSDNAKNKRHKWAPGEAKTKTVGPLGREVVTSNPPLSASHGAQRGVGGHNFSTQWSP